MMNLDHVVSTLIPQPPYPHDTAARSEHGLVHLARSFRIWMLLGYATISLCFIGSSVLAYRQLTDAQHDIEQSLLQTVPRAEATFTISQTLQQYKAQLVYQNIAVSVVAIVAAVIFTVLIAQGILRPLDTISQMLRGIRDGNSPPTSDHTQPSELVPFVRCCNTMVAVVEQRQQAFRDQLRRTALLTRLSIGLRESLDTDSIVYDLLKSIVANIDLGSASVMLRDQISNEAKVYVIRDHHVRVLPVAQAAVLLDTGLAGWVLHNGYSVVVPDIGRDKRWVSFAAEQSTGSAIAVPLAHNGMALGVLTISHPDSAHFTNTDLLLLEGVAALSSVAFSFAQRHANEQRRREQALLLFAMSQSLTVERTVDDLAQQVLQSSRSAFDASHTALFLCKDEGAPPTFFAINPDAIQSTNRTSDEDPVAAALFRLAPAVERVWRNQQAISGVVPTQTTAHTKQNKQHGRIHSYVALPLLHNGVAIGVFVLVCETQGPVVFSADLWSVLTTCTNVAAAAFANRQLVDRLHQRTVTLEYEVQERTIQLQHSRDLLRIVFDNLPDGLILLDSRATILTVNHAFAHRILGVQPQQVVHRNYVTMLHELQHTLQVHIDTPLHTGATQRIHCTDGSGQQRWYDIDRYAIQADGEQQRIERWRDVTRQEEIARQLLLHEQLASIGKLALSVVHEVGNPLQSVRGCLDLCREDTGLPASVSDYLSLADTELERMAQILERLRDLYRPAQLSWNTGQLNELVSVIQRITARQLQRHHVILHVELEAQLAPIYAQWDALRQVLLNLVLNAQEAMPSGGTLKIVTTNHAEQQMASLRITDTGIGMAPEQRAHLFEPFKSAKIQGLGLGLYLSKQIIDQHNGHIAVESHLGQGTTFTIWLPQAKHYHEENNSPDS